LEIRFNENKDKNIKFLKLKFYSEYAKFLMSGKSKKIGKLNDIYISLEEDTIIHTHYDIYNPFDEDKTIMLDKYKNDLFSEYISKNLSDRENINKLIEEDKKNYITECDNYKKIFGYKENKTTIYDSKSIHGNLLLTEIEPKKNKKSEKSKTPPSKSSTSKSKPKQGGAGENDEKQQINLVSVFKKMSIFNPSISLYVLLNQQKKYIDTFLKKLSETETKDSVYEEYNFISYKDEIVKLINKYTYKNKSVSYNFMDEAIKMIINNILSQLQKIGEFFDYTNYLFSLCFFYIQYNYIKSFLSYIVEKNFGEELYELYSSYIFEKATTNDIENIEIMTTRYKEIMNKIYTELISKKSKKYNIETLLDEFDDENEFSYYDITETFNEKYRTPFIEKNSKIIFDVNKFDSLITKYGLLFERKSNIVRNSLEYFDKKIYVKKYIIDFITSVYKNQKEIVKVPIKNNISDSKFINSIFELVNTPDTFGDISFYSYIEETINYINKLSFDIYTNEIRFNVEQKMLFNYNKESTKLLEDIYILNNNEITLKKINENINISCVIPNKVEKSIPNKMPNFNKNLDIIKEYIQYLNILYLKSGIGLKKENLLTDINNDNTDNSKTILSSNPSGDTQTTSRTSSTTGSKNSKISFSSKCDMIIENILGKIIKDIHNQIGTNNISQLDYKYYYNKILEYNKEFQYKYFHYLSKLFKLKRTTLKPIQKIYQYNNNENYKYYLICKKISKDIVYNDNTEYEEILKVYMYDKISQEKDDKKILEEFNDKITNGIEQKDIIKSNDVVINSLFKHKEDPIQSKSKSKELITNLLKIDTATFINLNNVMLLLFDEEKYIGVFSKTDSGYIDNGLINLSLYRNSINKIFGFSDLCLIFDEIKDFISYISRYITLILGIDEVMIQDITEYKESLFKHTEEGNNKETSVYYKKIIEEKNKNLQNEKIKFKSLFGENSDMKIIKNDIMNRINEISNKYINTIESYEYILSNETIIRNSNVKHFSYLILIQNIMYNFYKEILYYIVIEKGDTDFEKELYSDINIYSKSNQENIGENSKKKLLILYGFIKYQISRKIIKEQITKTGDNIRKDIYLMVGDNFMASLFDKSKQPSKLNKLKTGIVDYTMLDEETQNALKEQVNVRESQLVLELTNDELLEQRQLIGIVGEGTGNVADDLPIQFDRIGVSPEDYEGIYEAE